MAYSLKYSYDSASQSYSVTGWSGITTTDNVVIPSTYNDGTNGSHPVTMIGDHAFVNCFNLTSITIPDSVTSIGGSAFNYCNNLTSVTIPNSVISIGRAAFDSCSALTSITIPNSVTSIGNNAFYGCIGLTSVTIPNSVTSLGIGVFTACSSLISVTMPNSITSIGSDTFFDCSSLTSVTIPNSVTSIGSSAFYKCNSLTSITIPDNVTSIGDSVFYKCPSLKQLILFPSTPPTFGSSAIPTTISQIYVRQSSKEAYKTATNWTAFADKITSDDLYLSFARFNEKNKQYIKASIPDTSTVTIAASAWNNNSATVSVNGVTVSNNVFVTADAGSYLAYANARIRCTAQGSGMLTFACETTPTTAITVNILIFNS